MISFIFRLAVVLFIFILLAGFIRTFVVENSKGLDAYNSGTFPEPLPDGFYKGKVPVVTTQWRGKTFNDESGTGFNNFTLINGVKIEKYPFRTYRSKAVGYSDVAVLKIDYDVPSNPWWLRLMVDEIVQTSPDHYLGKLHLRILPFFPFTIEYFNLEK